MSRKKESQNDGMMGEKAARARKVRKSGRGKIKPFAP